MNYKQTQPIPLVSGFSYRNNYQLDKLIIDYWKLGHSSRFASGIKKVR